MGLKEARVIVEKNAFFQTAFESFASTGVISLADGALFQHSGATFSGSLSVEDGEATISTGEVTEIGEGSSVSIISGPAGSTLRFTGSTFGLTKYGSNLAILGPLRIVHDGNVLIGGGPVLGPTTLNPKLLEFAASEGSNSNLAVDGFFVTGDTTLAAGTNSEVTVDVKSTWIVDESIYVGGSTTATGGKATVNLVTSLTNSISNLEIADQLKIYAGGMVHIDGGSLMTEFLIMDPGAGLSLIDGSVTVDSGASVLPGSFAFGSGSGKSPQFNVVGGADVSVETGWRVASGVDTIGRTEIVGVDPLDAPSTLRNTSGGGSADLAVGVQGLGELLVAEGGLVDFSDDVVFGDGELGIGTGNVDGVRNGVRSTLRTRGGANSVIYVGRLGGGSLDITDGGLVTSAGDVSIADQANSSGQIHLFQTSSPNNGGVSAELHTADDLFVGGNGFGNLLIDTGGHVEVGDALTVNATSRLAMRGGTFVAGRLVHTAGGDVRLNSGRGELVAAGTLVTSPLTIGDGVSSGMMELVVATAADGAFGEITIQSNGEFEIVGQAIVAELSVATGGNLLVSGRVEVDVLNSGDGVLELDGGTFAVTQTQSPLIDNPVVVRGQATIEVTTDSTLALGGPMTGDGGTETLVKNGGGDLLLRGGNTLGGPLVVQDGRVFGDVSTLPREIENQGTVVFQQITAATYDGMIAGVGTLVKDEAGSLSLNAANTYTGDTAIDAGTLRIQQPFLHALADVYLASGSLFGLDFLGVNTIDSLFIDGDYQPSGTYGAVGSGADFESNHFTGAGLLQVTTFVGFHGDYNDDGVVNAADYTVWRNTLGAPAGTIPNDPTGSVIGQAQYDTWKANFGNTLPGAASLAEVEVPEPNSLVLVGFGGILFLRRSRSVTTGVATL